MADRTDLYFCQRVSEAELDLAFALLEKAVRNLAADLAFVGVVAGAAVSQHAPVPDLTVRRLDRIKPTTRPRMHGLLAHVRVASTDRCPQHKRP